MTPEEIKEVEDRIDSNLNFHNMFQEHLKLKKELETYIGKCYSQKFYKERYGDDGFSIFKVISVGQSLNFSKVPTAYLKSITTLLDKENKTESFSITINDFHFGFLSNMKEGKYEEIVESEFDEKFEKYSKQIK